MKTERETKEKLIASAKAEFMEKGYAKASLRKICANAGVTTGALYFFFDDKQDLFRAIVEPPLAALVEMIEEHFAEDKGILSLPDAYEHQEGDHDEIAEMLVRHLYRNYDAFLLLLMKSQGTGFEDSLHQIVDLTEKRFTVSAQLYARQKPEWQGDAWTIHWMAHMTVDAFVYLLTHVREEREAVRRMKAIMDFIVKGFVEMKKI